MKRASMIVGSAALLVVIVAAVTVAFMESRKPDVGPVACPTYVPRALTAALGSGYRTERWEIYSYEGQQGAPRVKVRPSSVVPDARRGESCELKIIWAPREPGAASDWRIGHTLANPRPLRGRTLNFNVEMKGSTEFRFDTAQIYIYDGVKVGGAPVAQVTRDWQSFQAAMPIDPSAVSVEVWIRLLLDKGTVRPGSGSLYFVASVDARPD